MGILLLFLPATSSRKNRLSEIDAPEKAQPYRSRTRQSLPDLIFSKNVLVVKEDIDRYGRLVGQVYVGNTDVNRKVVQDGMAWANRQYLQDEKAAREARRGLWSLPSKEQVPPWEWRKGSRSASSEESNINSPQSECGTKRSERKCLLVKKLSIIWRIAGLQP